MGLNMIVPFMETGTFNTWWMQQHTLSSRARLRCIVLERDTRRQGSVFAPRSPRGCQARRFAELQYSPLRALPRIGMPGTSGHRALVPQIAFRVGGDKSDIRNPKFELGGWAAFRIPNSEFLIPHSSFFRVQSRRRDAASNISSGGIS